MIKARFTMDTERNLVRLNLKGHAGMSTVGNDVVCSAASILAYTLAQEVKEAHTVGKLKYIPTIKLNSGNAKIECRCFDEHYGELVHAFKVAQTGYRLLQNQYPNFVKLTMFGEDE